MKYLIVLIFLGIVIESMFVVGQQLNNDNDDDDNERQTYVFNADNNNGNNRRPIGNLNRKYKRVLKVQKNSQQSLPVVGKRSNRPLSDSEADSVPASSIKKSFTVNNYDENDDDSFSRRRARFVFRQRVGK